MDVAIVSARGLGDGLLALVLARNLREAGRTAVLFHTTLCELSAWVPWATIEPLPEDEGLRALLADAPAVFVGDPALDVAPAPAGQARVVFRKALWDRSRPYLHSLRAACTSPFSLTSWDDGCGLEKPAGRPSEPGARRIALHPTSARSQKNWPAERWIALAARLEAEGRQPTVLLAGNEVDAWRAAAGTAVPVAVPGPLDAVADWLSSCDACVATDSGIAHLASAVGVPTLTIFRKRSAARFWGPAWGRTAVVTAPWRLPGGGGHRLWSRLLSPRRVRTALHSMLDTSGRFVSP